MKKGYQTVRTHSIHHHNYAAAHTPCPALAHACPALPCPALPYRRSPVLRPHHNLYADQSFAGIKIFLGGFLGKPMMKAFGQLGLTTASNFINCIAQTLGILARGPLMIYAHVLVTGIGERKRDGVETLLLAEVRQTRNAIIVSH